MNKPSTQSNVEEIIQEYLMKHLKIDIQRNPNTLSEILVRLLLNNIEIDRALFYARHY